MVSSCKNLLLKLREKCPLLIKWVRARNELAYSKTKAGARLEICGPEPIIPASKSWVKHRICVPRYVHGAMREPKSVQIKSSTKFKNSSKLGNALDFE